MKRWGLRHRGYRIGFIGIVVSSFFFMIGFMAPAWRVTTGLWLTCSSNMAMCLTTTNYGSLPVWFGVVRAFECMALIAILLCIGSEIYMDFLSRPTPDRRLVELLALISGTCGLIGCIIFAAFTPINNSGNSHYQVYLGWGFGLATASSCFLLAFASTIAYFRRKGLDAVSYAHSSSSAMRYCASDGVVTAQGPSVMDLGPPAYSEVVNQPITRGGEGQGASGSHPPDSSSQFNFYKPPTPDCQSPPAYYPPPSGEQFEAPPPYTIMPTLPVHSADAEDTQRSTESSVQSSETEGRSVTAPYSETNSATARTILATGSADNGTSDAVPAMPDSGSAALSTSTSIAGTGALSSVPAYYVTVFGQAVPVYLEELQQAGREVPSAGAPVPAYFIVTQGQHVPVYSEEQARTLNN